MCLIIGLLSLIGPRIALLFTWWFSSWVDRAFDGILIPLVGLLLLPWTTLAYVLVWRADGLGSLGWAIVAIGLLSDLAGYGTAGARR